MAKRLRFISCNEKEFGCVGCTGMGTGDCGAIVEWVDDDDRGRLMKRETREAFCSFMDGYMEEFEDLPDGAHQAVAQSAVEDFNEAYGTQIDPFDGWLMWIHHSADLEAQKDKQK